MKTIKLHQLVDLCRSETDAFDYLFQKKKELIRNFSPFCKGQELYIMISGRIRCRGCKADCNPFFDTKFSRLRIVCVSWLLLIKLFEIKMSARKAGIQQSLSYPTTLNIFSQEIKWIIIHEYLEIWATMTWRFLQSQKPGRACGYPPL